MWVLRTAENAEFPFMFRILPGNIKTVGRAPRADFIVDAPLVSRLHCRITADHEQLNVQDLASTNGTFVNGIRLTRERRLAPGDVLRIGETDLRFET